ncbi:prolyl oligopeptidase family protein [Actinidia rufa]|uniref:Prolyl oligopeptidase family protein n=1 Tax=Actinidia rufa TaxID=165716 RepID=A0A7J0D9F4_9ERIC|nr:prolyl oligopeptidase family protein [Actinidia rufa]
MPLPIRRSDDRLLRVVTVGEADSALSSLCSAVATSSPPFAASDLRPPTPPLDPTPAFQPPPHRRAPPGHDPRPLPLEEAPQRHSPIPRGLILPRLLGRLYYGWVDEGKQYPVLCRRLASLNEEFISHKSPSSGFDFTSGKRIEQKLLGNYRKCCPIIDIFAYTVYDKDNDYFKLSVRDLNFGSLCNKPQANWVSNFGLGKRGAGIALRCH